MTTVGTVLSGEFKPCKPITGSENAETRLAQVVAKQIHHVGFIFNNKHRILHGIRANRAEGTELWQGPRRPLRRLFGTPTSLRQIDALEVVVNGSRPHEFIFASISSDSAQ